MAKWKRSQKKIRGKIGVKKPVIPTIISGENVDRFLEHNGKIMAGKVNGYLKDQIPDRTARELWDFINALKCSGEIKLLIWTNIPIDKRDQLV